MIQAVIVARQETCMFHHAELRVTDHQEGLLRLTQRALSRRDLIEVTAAEARFRARGARRALVFELHLMPNQSIRQEQ
jgi:hypothetical protein